MTKGLLLLENILDGFVQKGRDRGPVLCGIYLELLEEFGVDANGGSAIVALGFVVGKFLDGCLGYGCGSLCSGLGNNQTCHILVIQLLCLFDKFICQGLEVLGAVGVGIVADNIGVSERSLRDFVVLADIGLHHAVAVVGTDV